MPKLEDWEMIMVGGPYDAPEAQSVHLTGRVYNHPRFEDGERIVTSMIMDLDVKNGSARTYSGSAYTLCKPSLKWVEWLKENGYEKHLEDLLNLRSMFVN